MEGSRIKVKIFAIIKSKKMRKVFAGDFFEGKDGWMVKERQNEAVRRYH